MFWFTKHLYEFKPIKQNSIILSRQGLEGELKLTKTTVILISMPYMSECKKYGESYIQISIESKSV